MLIDTVQGEPLRTPKLLGSGLLRQSSTTDAVALYTAMHGLALRAGLADERLSLIPYGLDRSWSAIRPEYGTGVQVENTALDHLEKAGLRKASDFPNTGGGKRRRTPDPVVQAIAASAAVGAHFKVG